MSREEGKYKIGQVAEMLGLEAYVLRFWETEFEQLRPNRTAKGQRYYTCEHIKLLKKIKKLLYKDKLTIDGARMRLEEQSRFADTLDEIKSSLLDIKKILS
ncbi:MerR family transcriptional regulator [Desulfonatronovibrio magnus]|uniref:MerR family transcriptional regulator n=1 Tax=Desulfonatronovibrio magnus TaxID=698827 RepID=UPI0005EB2C94|nr:MerR family transcriptional regulator [Desulfonatronovibrio magnus]